MSSRSPQPITAPPTSNEPSSTQPGEGPNFDTVYQEHAPYVWRAACRLGVGPSAVEDVVQDTFLVVHRRLSEYEERSSMRAWLLAILVSVVRDHRRAARRKPQNGSVDQDVRADTVTVPLEERMQAAHELYAILEAMNDARREVLVLVDLEGLSVIEAAQALAAIANIAHFRLRAARRELDNMLTLRKGAEREKARMSGLGPEARALIETASRQEQLPSAQSLRRVRRSIRRRAMVASAAVAASSATTLGATAGLVGASVTLQLASLALAGALTVGAFIAISARWRNPPSEAQREMATMPQRSPAAKPLDCAHAEDATPGR